VTQDRAGRGGLGCLISVVILVLIGYMGMKFIPPYMRYQEFRDEMRTEARFATTMNDSTIRNTLVARADTLGLPPAARRILISRRGGHPATVTISAEYIEEVNLPIFGVKLLHYKPSAEAPL
jgi:hypothetical protein